MEDQKKYYQVDLNQDDQSVLHWEVEEYLNHKKGLAWYTILIGSGFVLGLLAYLVTGGEFIAPISIILMTLMLAIYAFKKPQVRKYSLSEFGLKIGSRLYDFSSFKTFSLIKDNELPALYLVTNQRFIPPLTIYLPKDQGRNIIQHMSQYIAYTPMDMQLFDKIMRYLRF